MGGRPLGECGFNRSEIALAVSQSLENRAADADPMSLLTPGGRFQVSWDERGNVTAIGQVSFFAEFLDMTELFKNWVRDCPLSYSSGNAPAVRDVLGTWMLSILDGQWRYAHLASLRGDAVAPDILGMNTLVGDESLRRGLKHIAPAPKASHTEEQQAQQQAQLKRAEEWMETGLLESVKHALATDWILGSQPTLGAHGAGSKWQIGQCRTQPARPQEAAAWVTSRTTPALGTRRLRVWH